MYIYCSYPESVLLVKKAFSNPRNIKGQATVFDTLKVKKYKLLEIQPHNRYVPSVTILPSKESRQKRDVTGHISMHLLLSGKEESLHNAARIIA
jgi:hypothetical protein